ncbi:chromate transporter (plasmid) [Paraburkholderia sp. DD10]|uniref:chromate transporter n=1 Tax=Paraburkholderia sp. DD10 TaxID=3409691 RepID=UPI003BA24700
MSVGSTVTTTGGASAGPAGESLCRLFWVVSGLSSLSWGGLALMAQLEQHFVERRGLLTQPEYADLVALAWMTPGPVGCNVAVQLGYALRGRCGAWVAGAACVLPFFVVVTFFAIFYRSLWIRTIASPALLGHFNVVLATLIGVTWFRQTRMLARGRLEQSAAIAATAVLALLHHPAVYVALPAFAFLLGWCKGGARADRLRFEADRAQWPLAALVATIGLFALQIPGPWEKALLWPRLAGAGMTLFGGGFSALPVLKSLFVTPAVGLTESDYHVAFALSPISPGPLLNVVPFLGYLIQGWPGAIAATCALFVPSGCLVVLAQRHLRRVKTHARFERGMRVLRAVTTAFLAVAVLHIATRVPLQPACVFTAGFALVALGRLKLPVYLVYGIVLAACVGVSALPG